MNAILGKYSWKWLSAWCAALVAAAVLSSCGGSGAGAGGNGSVASIKAAALSLLTNQPSLGSDGQTTATLTAIVKNVDNVGLPGEPVVFSTTDPGAILLVDSAVTDESGRATAQLSISDRSVRTIIVQATSGTVVQSVAIPVVGTVISISGSNTIVFNSGTQFSLVIRDSSGNAVAGVPVSLSSSAGNTITPALAATDALGQATFDVTGVVAGTDVITASAQGVTSTFDVVVSGTQLTFTQPSAATNPNTANTDLEVSTSYPVEILLVENAQPSENQTIFFSATRGVLTAASAITNASGIATTNISSSSAGISTLTVTAGGSGTTATMQVEFISSTPDEITVQASPSVVGANIDPAGTKAAQIIAVVRDAASNPVKNQRVNFTSVNDPSNGRIEPGFGQTDSFGVATASFIAGSNPTGLDEVEIKAELQSDPTKFATTNLTVSEIQLGVSMGTGNSVEQTETTYTMPWTAVVADSAGNPVANAQVTVAVTSKQYRKGLWIADPNGNGWVPSVIAVCPSEDADGNGLLNGGEDTNNNGVLDPGSPSVAAVVGTGTTNASGLADIELTYPKSAGVWTEVLLKVTMTTTAGTEGTASELFWLPVESNDVSSRSIAPPGANAPTGAYGITASCTDPN